GHTYWVYSLALDKDGKTLVSGSLDGTLRFWDVEAGRETVRFGGTTTLTDEEVAAGAVVAMEAPWNVSSAVRTVCFTPDGNTLLVGGGRRTLKLFNPATHKEISVLWESVAPQATGMVPVPPDPPKQQDDSAKDKEKANPQPVTPPREWPEHVDIQFHQG